MTHLYPYEDTKPDQQTCDQYGDSDYDDGVGRAVITWWFFLSHCGICPSSQMNDTYHTLIAWGRYFYSEVKFYKADPTVCISDD